MVTINLLVEAGNAKPGPALSQQVGPLGINLGKLIADVNKASEKFRGMKVPVEVIVNPETRDFKINVKTPPTSELIKKELALQKGSGDAKLKVGNLAIEQAIKIAKVKKENMYVSSFKACLKSVIGTCSSLGVLVEGKEPKELIKEVDSGMHSEVIERQITEVSTEKKKRLAEQLKVVQERVAKKLAEEKAAAEAEKAKKVEKAEEVKEGEEVAEEKKVEKGEKTKMTEVKKEKEIKEEKPKEEKKKK